MKRTHTIAMRICFATLTSFVVALAFTARAEASPRAPVAVTACGQEVPRGTLGYLTGDLDCTGPQSGAAALAAVILSRRGVLELRGHSIRGSHIGVACTELGTDDFGNEVLGRPTACTIDGGGGVIADAEAHGVTGRILALRNLTIRDVGGDGAWAHRKAVFDHVTITGSGGMGAQIWNPGKVFDSTITGNGSYGIDAGKLVLVRSTVTGNSQDPACGTPPPILCADLHIYRFPRLTDSTCGTSVHTDDNRKSWGICTND